MSSPLQRAFGGATALLRRTRGLGVGDLALVAALGGLVYPWVGWARYGDLFAYDEEEQLVSL